MIDALFTMINDYSMTINNYIESITKRFNSGISREHSYRGDLEALIRELVTSIEVTNEPANVTDCGNPDYVITKGKIPIGYIEAKDIGKDLNAKQYKEQFGRYKKALENLIITDYIWFQFFQDGELVYEVKIAEITNNTISPITDNYLKLEQLLKEFCTYIGQTIKSPKKLAEMMAGKARLLENILEQALTSDEETQDNSSLKQQYRSFKNLLIHDLSIVQFADIYAQTLAYGMFAARLHDKTLDDFSRQEAAELIPKSNPFLRSLFAYVSGPDIDERIKRTVDNLADVFRATNIKEFLDNFVKNHEAHDPIIHFYETFLSEYNPKLRKSRGVWYTPLPVVKFIVKAVDEVLKSDFNCPQGIADSSKKTIKREVPGVKVSKGRNKGKPVYDEIDVHKVQILDPGTGTGTFLAEVINYIYSKNYQAMQGMWDSYVDEHLIPRLHGFEILMASYSMAHLKLDMVLTETGYKSSRNQRLKVYLTNSLEEADQDTDTLFSSWLSTEANEANLVKRDTPLMVIMGNPPYSGESANKGQWIMDLMDDYKKEPGGKEKLQERNSKWINDDYVKFLRYGQHYIEQNGEGILAFINPHGFLDNPTFRGMRWNLLKTYDKIYTIDLHGNSKKKEVCPDGSKDENVFDIMQGVSINLFVKTGKKKKNELGKVFHYDLYGKREEKYDFLLNNVIDEIPYIELQNIEPNYFFVPKDYKIEKEYKKFFKITDLMELNIMGFQTHRDNFATDEKHVGIIKKISDFLNMDITSTQLKEKYFLKESKTWIIEKQRKLIDSENINSNIYPCSYRPFDNRFVFVDTAINDRPRNSINIHFNNKNNICLLIPKQQSILGFQHILISKFIASDCTISGKSREGNQVFPLYLYSNNASNSEIKTNLNTKIIEKIAKIIQSNFNLKPEKLFESGESIQTINPIDIVDYIYANLHSPSYREKYKEFLKIDFPKIPYPTTQQQFWQLVNYGSELRSIHLLESDQFNELSNFISSYPNPGDNVISRSINQKDWEIIDQENPTGRIWINDEQYFNKIPLSVWEFYIGGYQPAQKWLKDRKGRTLSFDEILHYQKIILALAETDRIMHEIKKIEID